MIEPTRIVKPKPVFVAHPDERPSYTRQVQVQRVAQQRTVDKSARAHRTETRKERESFQRVRNAEKHYAAQLRKVARQVGMLANFGGGADDPATVQRLSDLLRRYSQDIRPWARTAATAMLADVNRRDERAWMRLSQVMGSELEYEIRNAPTGAKMLELLEEQVDLITSIPLDAAQRVHKMATQNLVSGTRADQIARAIQTSEHVSRGRANLIARTEVGRASGALTQARAEFVGITHYVWRSLGDVDVRPLHRRLNGTVHAYDRPPVSGEAGERAHAGMIYNCRCYMEPVIT